MLRAEALAAIGSRLQAGYYFTPYLGRHGLSRQHRHYLEKPKTKSYYSKLESTLQYSKSTLTMLIALLDMHRS
jgi:hypothetical protein